MQGNLTHGWAQKNRKFMCAKYTLAAFCNNRQDRMKFLLCFIFFGLLVGCQTNHVAMSQRGVAHKTAKSKTVNHKKVIAPNQSEKDGAPPGPAPSWFSKVFPKHEPLSRYGNPGTYQVDGHTYEILTSAGGYRARGLASWYGTKFHSRRTSSGEDYDMYKLTAAHKTLPIPTYVRVKNLSNGREAIVRVNDRGPFHSGRVIDLSYAAAAKLGLLPKGTAPVEIEALSTTTHGKAHVAHYYLQAGAFSSEKFAQSLRSKLSKLTPSPVFIEKYQQKFIVRAGPFANKQMTEQLKKSLTRYGVSGAFSLMI